MKRKIFAVLLMLALLSGCGAADTGAEQPRGSASAQEELEVGFPADWKENGTLAEYSEGNISMSLLLPQGWNYSIQQLRDGSSKGILFGKGSGTRFLLSAWPGDFGMCGTGVDFQELTLPGGWKLTEAREDTHFLCLIFQDTAGTYTLRPEDGTLSLTVWEICRDEVLAILDTAALGGDALTQTEAVAAAMAQLDGIYDGGTAYFDLMTGEWTVSLEYQGRIDTTAVLDAQGTFLRIED